MGVAPSGHAMGLLRTGMFFQNIPVFRSAYFPQRVHSTLCSKTLDLQVRSAHPPMPHGMPLRGIPVFRMAFSVSTAHCAVETETLMLQVRSAHPSVGGGSFALPFLRTGMFFQNIPVFRSAYFPQRVRSTLCSGKRSTSSRFAASGGRGELRSPLHPPLPPPLFIGRFAASDRQIPKEDVFILPNAAFAQLSLAHSAAFCYSFLNNRTRCGKRRLLP